MGPATTGSPAIRPPMRGPKRRDASEAPTTKAGASVSFTASSPTLGWSHTTHASRHRRGLQLMEACGHGSHFAELERTERRRAGGREEWTDTVASAGPPARERRNGELLDLESIDLGATHRPGRP